MSEEKKTNSEEELYEELEEPLKEEQVEEPVEEKDESDQEDEYGRLQLSMVRLQADFENYKRRSAIDMSKRFEAGKIDIAEDLIPVIDNLERAIDSMEDQGLDPENIKGVSMIEDQFRDVLQKNGIEEIDALNEVFDPNFHHAVAMVETEDHEPNIVVDVLQKGYKINETIIRPSMVRVSK